MKCKHTFLAPTVCALNVPERDEQRKCWPKQKLKKPKTSKSKRRICAGDGIAVQVFDVLLQRDFLIVQLFLLVLQLRDLCLQNLYLLQHLLSWAACVLAPGHKEDKRWESHTGVCISSFGRPDKISKCIGCCCKKMLQKGQNLFSNLHWIIFLFFFSISPTPSSTLVMSYILLFCFTARLSAACWFRYKGY